MFAGTGIDVTLSGQHFNTSTTGAGVQMRNSFSGDLNFTLEGTIASSSFQNVRFQQAGENVNINVTATGSIEGNSQRGLEVGHSGANATGDTRINIDGFVNELNVSTGATVDELFLTGSGEIDRASTILHRGTGNLEVLYTGLLPSLSLQNQGAARTLVDIEDADNLSVFHGATADDINIIARGDIDGSAFSSIYAFGGTGTNIEVHGTIANAFGTGIRTATDLDVLTTIILADGASVSAASGQAIFNDDGDSIVTALSGSQIIGDVILGDGDDTLMLQAMDTSLLGILDGGDDYSTADGFIDQLTLQNLTGTLVGGNLLNWESIVLDGAQVSFSDGLLTAGDATGATGLYLLNGTTLDGARAFALTGNLFMDAGTTFLGEGGGSGVYSFSADVMNNGAIDLADGVAGDQVAVAGDYAGDGALLLDANLATLAADQMVISGDVIGGTTGITITDVGTAYSSGGDIVLVDVTGTTADDAFYLTNARLTSGAYRFELEQQSQDWVLASHFLEQVPTYEALPRALLSLSEVDTFQQRTGNRQYLMTGDDPDGSYGAWLRFSGSRSSATPDVSTTGLSYDLSNTRWEAGLDMPIPTNLPGTLTAGLLVYGGSARMDVTAPDGNGVIDADTTGVGATLTWMTPSFYADAQIRAGQIDATVTGVSGIEGESLAASIEAGYRMPLNAEWTLTPQAQLVWSRVDFEDFTGPDGEMVSLQDGETTRLRIGASAERSWTTASGDLATVYGIANLHYQPRNQTAVMVSGTELLNGQSGWSAELGLGGSYSWNDGLSGIYGEIAATEGIGYNASNITATLGFVMRF